MIGFILRTFPRAAFGLNWRLTSRWSHHFSQWLRKDNQIKISGRRIEIGEIEFVLSKFEKTKNSVVVPILDEKAIVRGCVAFIDNKISKIEEIEIRSKSLEFLDKVFFPKKIITITNFPLNVSGKIDRNKLKEMI